jgi:flavin-dependent dehydrogenase
VLNFYYILEMNIEKVDVLVIGAGPSGTVAASIINKAGYKVKIVEKEQFPRFVIGESLLPGCMEALDEAGFIPAITARGFQEKSGAKFVNAEKKVMDFNFSDRFTDGWSWTWQVKRADFDHTLAQEAERMGVAVDYKTTVTHIEFSGTDSMTTVIDPDGKSKQLSARFIVDASGYGRVIPRMFKMERPSDQPPRKALFTHITDDRRMTYSEPNRILIVDHQPGVWMWCIPFSDGTTSVGVVSSPEFFDNFTGTPEQQLRAIIATNVNICERFEDCHYIFDPRVLQSWSATCDKFYGDGFVLTGNVTEFLDPIFSSGVTLAVASSQFAAHLVIKKLKGQDVNWQTEYMDRMMIGIDTFRTYVMAWYDGTLQKIFFHNERPPDNVQKICSVLAGYVWDQKNPFVKDAQNSVNRLARLIDLHEKITAFNAL